MRTYALFSLLFLLIIISGCSENTSYSCTYESRHTGCGGKEWTIWVKDCVAFNMDDYKEGWTPEKVCEKYSGTDTNCGGGCCIEIEYRNNMISKGTC